MASHNAEPRGRKELLFWLNSLCNAQYPSVESLRDGAAYCTVIEAAVSRVAQNCAALQTFDANNMKSRASKASAALSSLDWSATANVCENIDPSLDSMSIRKVCRHNTYILQDMLSGCVPPDHVLKIDVERLSGGKLQDHVKFLQWLYQFMTKILAQYSKSSLEKKASRRPGEVAGVKLNRATKLLEHKRNPASASTTPRAQQQQQQQRHSSSRERSKSRVSVRSSMDSEAPSSAAAHREEDDVVGTMGSRPLSPVKVETVKPPPAAHPLKTAEPPAARAVMHYRKGTESVPSDLKETLLDLRREVEELEQLVNSAHEAHQNTLTRQGDDGDSTVEEGPLCLSLHGLGKLLEQRDALAHAYSAVDGIVRRHHAQGLPTPLLTDLCAILYP